MNSPTNVECTSNVYVIRGDFHTDREFQSKVRGRENLYKMLKVLAGLSWVAGEVSVDPYIDKYLTEVQKQEWMADKYCALLGDREEKVWGLVKRGKRLSVECRCYKTDCSLFKNCRPNHPHDCPEIIPPSAGIPEIVEDIQGEESPGPEVDLIEDQGLEENGECSGEFTGDTRIIEFEAEPDIPRVRPDRDYLPSAEASSPAGAGQEKIIKGSPDDCMLVQAGPGTGKTHSLLRKLEYMVDEMGMVAADSILVLCFTRAAVREIRERFRAGVESGKYSDDLSRLEIRTFDSFATRVLVHKGVDLAGKDYDTRIEMAIEEIRSDPDILEEMRHFIVDEIQDLVGVRARLVQTILSCKPRDCGFTLLGDPLQGIYDYQVRENPGELDAKGLLKWIKEDFSDRIKIINLTGNCRQSGELAALSARARQLLETGEENCFARFLESIRELECCGRDYNFSLPMDLNRKIAVLCRTNGEALKISGYLRQRGIEHELRRQCSNLLLPVWVADLLSCADGNLTREQLAEIAGSRKLWPEDENERMYSILHMFGEQRTERVVNLNTVKRALADGARLPDEFYEHSKTGICVSTIHQSKGREFDEVLLLSPRNHEEGDLFEEAKIYYVAITRAKKKLRTIERSGKRTWLKKSERTERWMELASRNNPDDKRPKLISVEIGREGDVDEEGFVDGNLHCNPEENQKYIRNTVKPGDRVEIRLDKHGKIYLIYHDGRLIGKMSGLFVHELREILDEVYFSHRYQPRGFQDIYVDRIYSIVKKPETIRTGVVEPYFTTGVWYGVSLVGLGKVRWSTDY